VLDRLRYRPAQWGDTSRWHTYPDRAGGRWFGFDAVVQLDNLPPEILLVPLPGHTPGHAGVAIEGPRGWVLHAADTYFNRAEVHALGPSAKAPPAGALAYERMMAWNPALARANQARVRELVASREAPMAVFCTHDPGGVRGDDGVERALGEAGGRGAGGLTPTPPPGPPEARRKLAARRGHAADAQDLGPRQFEQRDEGALALRRAGHRPSSAWTPAALSARRASPSTWR
jgi:glyoxylase-like metal-dependent hydrolase (beta-lactamase superfamily II)